MSSKEISVPNHDGTLLAGLRQQYDNDSALLEHMDREHSKLRAEHEELEAEYDTTSKQLGKALADLATSEAKRDVARELIGTVRAIAETWRADPGVFPDGAADPLERIATVLLGPPSTRKR